MATQPHQPAGALKAADSPAAAPPGLRVVCWGTRGSVPSPGSSTIHFGGNTPCVEVRASTGPHLVLDAGTGIRLLSQALARQPQPADLELFLTHFHWDHVQGFPFFSPLYDPAVRLRIYGPPQDGTTVEKLLTTIMGPYYFPLSFDAVQAELTFLHLEDTLPWSRDGVHVSSFRMQHPGNTHGFRIRSGDAVMAYVPDDELAEPEQSRGPGWYDELLGFLDGVDLLMHDAMYTEEEYRLRKGWGHSTFDQALQLARDAGVRRLCLFHHAPDRTDQELVHLLTELGDRAARSGSDLEVIAATEGEELLVPDSRAG